MFLTALSLVLPVLLVAALPGLGGAVRNAGFMLNRLRLPSLLMSYDEWVVLCGLRTRMLATGRAVGSRRGNCGHSWLPEITSTHLSEPILIRVFRTASWPAKSQVGAGCVCPQLTVRRRQRLPDRARYGHD